MNILAIDPGPVTSTWLRFETFTPDHSHGWPGRVVDWRTDPNPELLADWSVLLDTRADLVVFEKVESYGMAVGRDVFETVFWTGRHAQTVLKLADEVGRLSRHHVKLTLCQSARANDSIIRTRLKDLYGGEKAVGGIKSPGPLYGVKNHGWAALAVAVAAAQALDKVEIL